MIPFYRSLAPAVFASIFISQVAKPVTFVRVLHQGEELRYSQTTSSKLGEYAITQKETDRMAVKAVRPNGEAVLETGVVSGTMTLNGKEQAMPVSNPLTITVDRLNRVLSVTQPEEAFVIIQPPVRRLVVTSFQVVLPEKPVAPGDSWDTAEENAAVTGKKLRIHSTFNGPEKLDGAEVWKVTQHMDADTDPQGGKMTSDLVAWLDPSNLNPVKFTLAMKRVPTQFGMLEMSSTTTLLKSAAK